MSAIRANVCEGAALTVVAVADTHGYHDDLDVPDGDILIHAGDLTRTGSLDELPPVNAFLARLPHRDKIVIAGNHDACFQARPRAARAALSAAIYLQDESIHIRGLHIYGSPWQPRFLDMAFNLDRGPALAAKWALVPSDVDILVTHTPPLGFGDSVGQDRVGCVDLLARVRQVRPRLHIFGHIHSDRGRWLSEGTLFVNATTDECMAPATTLVYPPGRDQELNR